MLRVEGRPTIQKTKLFNSIKVNQDFDSIFDKELDADTILNRIQLRSPDAMRQGWNAFWVKPGSKAMDFLKM